MSSVKDKAIDQAQRHAKKFFEENEWPDILEKYAEVSNRASDELNRLAEREERGARIAPEDEADYYYYDRYKELFAYWIANTQLSSGGYERDKHNNWILKKQPPMSTKKRFGFWK